MGGNGIVPSTRKRYKENRMASDVVNDITDQNFEEEIESGEGLYMVDFWADWCGPCKMIAPTLDQLAEEYDGKVLFAKVDVDSNPNLSVKFFVRSIPMNVIFKDGKPVDQIVGAVGKQHFEEKLKAVV